MEYLLSVLLIGTLALVIIFFKSEKFNLKRVLKTLIPIYVLGIVWDWLAITREWWRYSAKHLVGVTFFWSAVRGLPFHLVRTSGCPVSL